MRKKTSATHSIEFKTEVDGVSSFSPVDFRSFSYDIKCTNCGDIRYGVIFDNTEVEASGTRGTFNFVMNCKCCGRQSTISYISSKFDNKVDDYSQWNQLLTLDCRGCDIVRASCNDWNIVSESDNKYEWDGKEDFFEYDEDLEKPVTVSDLQLRVSKG